MKNKLYRMLRISNDINALRKGKMFKRIMRRLAGKATGKGIGRLFK
ncbi:hypothetical protein JOC34_000373 [Virgibacillus halotolerans]|nr:hypothetical protein [Virgibacillus halotolerans]